MFGEIIALRKYLGLGKFRIRSASRRRMVRQHDSFDEKSTCFGQQKSKPSLRRPARYSPSIRLFFPFFSENRE